MNYQHQQMNSNNTDGTPIGLLRNDLNNNVNKDDESHYSVGSIDTTTDIRNLVNEINTNIKSKKENDTENDTENDDKNNLDVSGISDTKKNDEKAKKKKKKNNKYKVPMEDYLYDFVLLFIIFMLMSQDFVKNFIGSYIKIININEKGIVPISGVATYGVIFVTVFILSKIFINKISEI
jgi:hypothetical protein